MVTKMLRELRGAEGIIAHKVEMEKLYIAEMVLPPDKLLREKTGA
jgi:hypothetical protein